jgi:cytochrome P450
VLLIPLPGRTLALPLAGEDARRVLTESPGPFALATREKRAALAHFQPHGVLASDGARRAERRRFNEAVLVPEDDRPPDGDRYAAVVEAELAPLADAPVLTAADIVPMWWRIVRRVVLGDAGRDDEETTDLLLRLRRAANWAYLHPKRPAERDLFLGRLAAYVERAEPGSLAARVAAMPAGADVDAVQQLPQWLFAFDAGALATIRALALAATHPDAGLDEPWGARASVLESLRLWPTTPAILREVTTPTRLRSVELAEGTSVVIYAPFFHRDDERLPDADRFHPARWQDGRTVDEAVPVVPFSAGPGQCPGRNVVLHVAACALDVLARRPRHLVSRPRLDPNCPLPGTLDPFSLRFGAAGAQ